MMRAMFSGVSGLKAHQVRMDVIGNNVANVNTVGYKSGRATFAEIFSQTLRGASAPDSASGRGGTNPMQVGLGIDVGAIDTIMTRGSVQRTDNPTDLSIDGEGFFIVKGGAGDTYKFTRAGNFTIDKLGNLVTANGLYVYGWHEYTRNSDGTYTFNTERDAEPLNFYYDDYNKNKRIIPAKQTDTAVFAGNLDATDAVIDPADVATTDPHFKVPVIVYDALGNSYKLDLKFWKTGVDPGTSTTWTIQVEGAGVTTQLSLVDGSGTAGTQEITFDNKGNITGDSTFILNVAPNTATQTAGVEPFDITLDLSKLTMYAADSSVKATDVNGYTTGKLVTFIIDSKGVITGIYDNGQQQPLGQIALAYFDNPAALQKVGDNMFMETTNSGSFTGKGFVPGSEGVGALSPGTLEMSNVDLSREFTDMIITQRGFQANSRIITVSDEMLQELVNLKR